MDFTMPEKDITEKEKIINTINFLKHLISRRNLGFESSYITDPSWLVNEAINRRAKWLEDPSTTRGSCKPINGKYPRKAIGDYYRHLRQLADRINTPRLIIRENELADLKPLILKKIPHRIYKMDNF